MRKSNFFILCSIFALHILSSSSAPTDAPSSAPSTTQQQLQDQWHIKYTNAENDYALSFLSLEYEIAKDKTGTQLVSNILDINCELVSNSSVVIVNSTTVQIQPSETYDKGVVSLLINSTSIKDSPFWNETGNGFGFCVKSELLLSSDSSTGLSVSFDETVVRASMVLETGFYSFHIESVGLNKAKEAEVDHESELKVEACICDLLTRCIESPVLAQNSEFYVCVFPQDNLLHVNSIHSVNMWQDGIAKYRPVSDGTIANEGLTSVIVGSPGIIVTRLISRFFDDDVPSDIYIDGTVVLGFPFSTRRLLQQSLTIHDNQQASFNIAAKLKPPQSHLEISYSFILVTLILSLGYSFGKAYNRGRNDVKYTVLENEMQ